VESEKALVRYLRRAGLGSGRKATVLGFMFFLAIAAGYTTARIVDGFGAVFGFDAHEVGGLFGVAMIAIAIVFLDRYEPGSPPNP
jgi:hypothetical protein